MSDTTNNADGERTSLAPILAPIITLFIGFGAGVVFSEFIPAGKGIATQPNPTANPGAGAASRDDPRDSANGETGVDAEVRKALEDAAAEGDDASKKALEEMDHGHDHADHGG